MKTEFEEIASPATLCRVCMATGEDHFANLYDEFPFGQELSLHKMLQAICAPVFVHSDSANVPEMPARVCNVCQDAIIAAFSLHQQCIETDSRLGELLAFEKDVSQLESNDIAEGVVDCLNETGQLLTMVDVDEKEMPTETVRNVSNTCPECGKLFSRRFTLLRHQRRGVCPGKSNDTNPKDPLLENRKFPESYSKKITKKLTLDRYLKKAAAGKQTVAETTIFEKNQKTCAQCGKTFARAYTLFRHKRTGACAGTEQMFPCRICYKVYNTPNLLHGHYKRQHKSKVCPAENVVFASEPEIGNEEQKEMEESKPGEEAEFGSEDQKELEESKFDEVIDNPSMTSDNMVMIKVEALDLMDVNETENRSSDSENVAVKIENEPAVQQVTEVAKTCSVCLETVGNMLKMKIHMRSCHQLYMCEFCDALLPSRHILWYHKLKHKEPNVTCTVCGKKISSKYNLELHMLRHAGVKMHACELCSMRFTTPGAKTNHMRVHKKERPFVCDICGKRVVTRASLAKHIREIHEKIRRFVCTVCTRKFASKSHLVCHMLTHTKEKPYKCKLCPQAYSQTNDLVRHVSRAHWTGKPYPCDRCDESFRIIQDLREHYRVHVPSGDGLNEMEEVRFSSMAIMEKLFAKVKQAEESKKLGSC